MESMEKLLEAEGNKRRVRRGDVLEGEVIIIEDKTIYLELKDVFAASEGVVHLNQYTKDSSILSFHEILKLGDIVTVQVGSIVEDDEKYLILLTRLPLAADENFQKIEAFVKEEKKVTAKVTKVLERGLVLNFLENEIFLPLSLLDFELVNKKDDLLNTNLEVVIIEASKRGRRTRIIGSRKPIFEEARQQHVEEREEARQQELTLINAGDVLTGTVDRLDPHAAIVRFENVAGLLRISQVSHIRIEKLEDALTLGQEVTVKVIKKEGNRLDLSMKALTPTPFVSYVETNKSKDIVTGKIFQKLPFGLIVELSEDVRGLLHRSEYSWNPDDDFSRNVVVGDEIEVQIINVDKNKERIALSRKSLEDNPWANAKVKRGQTIEVEILEATPEGVKVKFGEIEGLISLEELSTEQTGKIDEIYQPGNKVIAFVTDFNIHRWIFKLSIKRAEQHAERQSFEKYLKEEEKKDDTMTIADLLDDVL